MIVDKEPKVVDLIEDNGHRTEIPTKAHLRCGLCQEASQQRDLLDQLVQEDG